MQFIVADIVIFCQTSHVATYTTRLDCRYHTLLKLDVTRRDHVSVVMDAGSRIVNFIVNFIRNGTVFA